MVDHAPSTDHDSEQISEALPRRTDRRRHARHAPCGTRPAARVSQCEVSGELEAALASGIWTKGTPAELGEVITGAKPGRTSPDAITICDLTGTGVQDTAIATHVRARFGNAGTIIRA